MPSRGAEGIAISAGELFYNGKWGRHDHAEVYIGGADDNARWGYTVSAYPNRQGMRPLPGPPSEIPGAVWSTGRIELTFEQRAGIVQYCRENFRIGYGWADYAALTVHRLGIPAPGLEAYIASTKTQICSQFVDSAYLLGGGVHLFSDGRWPGYVTPESLAELISA